MHACNNLGLSVSYYVPHTYVSHISSAPKIRTPYTQNNISYFGGMYRKNKGVPGLELATYRHAHQKQACTLLYTCVACFFFLFWWDVALYPTLKQTAVLGCIKSSTSAVTRALRCQLRGLPFHPWAGRLRFSGEAHPGPATHLRRRDGTVRIFFHCTGERKSITLSAPRQYVALQVVRTSYHINII